MKDLNRSNNQPFTYQISKNKNPICYCGEQDELDQMIINLKAEIFEKQQNARDYCALENKFLQLRNDIKIIADEKENLERELVNTQNVANPQTADLRTQNENLLSELNDKNLLNKKIYGDNNNLYQNLEQTTCQNQDLREQICQQEEVLDKLGQEKCNLENTLFSLTNLNEKQKNDIKTLQNQMKLIDKESNELNNSLKIQNSETVK